MPSPLKSSLSSNNHPTHPVVLSMQAVPQGAFWTAPTVPWMFPNPTLPTNGVGNAQVPNGVLNVCVNCTFCVDTTPPTVTSDIAAKTVGYCVAAASAAAPPPRAAFCARVSEGRMRTPRRTERMVVDGVGIENRIFNWVG